MTDAPPPLRPPLFDAHLHVVDPRFPLIPNDGYLRPAFTALGLPQPHPAPGRGGRSGGVGSFQGFNQTYLLAALAELGPGFVGVTQLPATTPDEQISPLAATAYERSG